MIGRRTVWFERRLSLAADRGHPVVIDFWASWCDIRDTIMSARAYVADLKVPYPSVFDPSSANTAPFQVDAPPTIIVVDGSGAVVGRYLGTVSGIAQQLDHLLASAG